MSADRRVVELGNKLVLIWDQTYWELYYIFLYGLADLQSQLRLTNSMDYDRTFTALVINPFLYFLSLVVNDKILSKKFAYHYHLSTLRERIFDKNIPFLTLSEYFEISKHYASIHEQIHISLRRGEIDKTESLYIKLALDNLYKSINEFNDNFMSRFYLFPQNILLEAILLSSSDNRMLDEILCDIKASLHCHKFYLNYWKVRYKKEVILTKCKEAIDTLHIFDAMLLNLMLIWKSDIKNNRELETSQRLCCMRAHLSELVFSLLQVQQNLDMAYNKNSMLFNLIDDKFIVEELFYRWFLQDDVIDFWINKALLPSYHIDIFKLLEWEIKS